MLHYYHGGINMNITVFLGSRIPSDTNYLHAAEALGTQIAQRGHTLVYGGAKVGSMGALARAALAQQGSVIGIMPKVLTEKEILLENLTEAIVVEDMHERKMRLQELGDVFVALPGGCGTLEEIFEVITWNQIGVHEKPYCFLNINGYYDALETFLKHSVEVGFTTKEAMSRIHFFDDIPSLFAYFNL